MILGTSSFDDGEIVDKGQGYQTTYVLSGKVMIPFTRMQSKFLVEYEGELHTVRLSDRMYNACKIGGEGRSGEEWSHLLLPRGRYPTRKTIHGE